ncbi:MAG: hypothetical protein IMF26_01880 [Candidatus Fermentithermobacillus carboniphilus]|uniref:DUF4320 family protein n=1 Tax=Candidatus Fermentithermobacillus carboniphilus TaxID=3085328 RepID=A0AAT9LE63_9FIRM|nr:MAG: hypothetical protein IMF26_01880 [Candidatus Fermentithermobacillus carboniphilus]
MPLKIKKHLIWSIIIIIIVVHIVLIYDADRKVAELTNYAVNLVKNHGLDDEIKDQIYEKAKQLGLSTSRLNIDGSSYPLEPGNPFYIEIKYTILPYAYVKHSFKFSPN